MQGHQRPAGSAPNLGSSALWVPRAAVPPPDLWPFPSLALPLTLSSMGHRPFLPGPPLPSAGWPVVDHSRYLFSECMGG